MPYRDPYVEESDDILFRAIRRGCIIGTILGLVIAYFLGAFN